MRLRHDCPLPYWRNYVWSFHNQRMNNNKMSCAPGIFRYSKRIFFINKNREEYPWKWSYGVSLLTGKKTGLNAKTVVTAPFMIAIAAGIILFFSKLSLPTVLEKTPDFCAGLNTPLAMFAVGIYLAQCSFSKMFNFR